MRDKIFELIERERTRQEETLELIPSENYASAAVREAVGSVMMNKYAEGQAGARYYQGNEIADEVEGECGRRALAAFGLSEDEWGVNVQALSGSPANLAVYNGLLTPGDKIMSMYLPDGGHLSHGWELPGKKISIVSKIWKVEQYKTDPKTRLFDYEAVKKQAEEFGPKIIVSGGTAYPREINYQAMGKIADSVRAFYLADVAHEAGLIAAGVCKSPFEAADVVTMTTHKTLRGPRGALIFSRRGIVDKIDFSVFPGIQGGPHLHTIAGIAVALGEVVTEEFKAYAKQVVKNARVLAAELLGAGFDVVSGGTDKHLVLVDLRNKGMSGWVLAWALEAAGIVVNRNTVPLETASPFYPSGIRLGTPAVTTRGMAEPEMKQIAGWLVRVTKVAHKWQLPKETKERKEFVREFMDEVWEEAELQKIKGEVRELCGEFPLKN